MKYNIETIKEICKPYGYSAYNMGYNCRIDKLSSNDEIKNQENWWKPEIFCKTNDELSCHVFDYHIDRFAICFSGYGTLEPEEENKVMNNLKLAKELVEKLNEYVNKCNEKFKGDE